MTLSFAVLDALVNAGCTAAQLVAALKADAGLVSEVAGSNMNEPAKSGIFATEASWPERGPDEAQGSGGLWVNQARKALGLLPGLGNAAKLVGAALLEHVNRKTGRCDPSIGTLMRVSGLSERSVYRAIEQLDRLGLILRHSHASFGHRNAYAPQWRRLEGIAGGLDRAVTGERTPAKMNEPAKSAAPRQNWQVEPARFGTQTLQVNPVQSESVVSQRPKPPPDPRQPQMLLPIDGRKGVAFASHALAADSGADRRLWRAINGKHKGRDNPFLDALQANPDALARAVERERLKPGTGLLFLELQLSQATGPPVAGTG